MINPKIEELAEKKLIGLNTKMSLANNKTGQLWGQFAPRIKEIQNRISADKISMQVYPALYYQQFKITSEFEKWATVEVNNFAKIPYGIQSFVLQKGLYAVFDHRGSSSDNSIFQYIFTEWIPKSKYIVDNRPHFEVLGTNYKKNDPDSEEEIWIPIREE